MNCWLARDFHPAPNAETRCCARSSIPSAGFPASSHRLEKTESKRKSYLSVPWVAFEDVRWAFADAAPKVSSRITRQRRAPPGRPGVQSALMEGSVADELNPDLIGSGLTAFPQPGREVLAERMSIQLGSSYVARPGPSMPSTRRAWATASTYALQDCLRCGTICGGLSTRGLNRSGLKSRNIGKTAENLMRGDRQ